MHTYESQALATASDAAIVAREFAAHQKRMATIVIHGTPAVQGSARNNHVPICKSKFKLEDTRDLPNHTPPDGESRYARRMWAGTGN